MADRARITVVLLTVLIIAGSQVPLSRAPGYSSNTIATSGTIANPTPSSSFDPKLFSVAYDAGWANNWAFARDNIDLIDINWFEGQESQLRSVITQIKATNPNFKAIIYVDYSLFSPNQDFIGDPTVINSHEEWFLHDSSGNRCQIIWTSGSQLMDISNVAWRQYLTDWIVNTLNANPMIDGVFVDNVWGYFIDNQFYTTPYPAISDSWWVSNMASCLAYLNNRIGNKLIIPNTYIGQYDTTSYGLAEYYDASDGLFIEAWVNSQRGASAAFGKSWIPFDYVRWISAARDIVKKGKYFCVYDGGSSQSEFYYSYSSFLLIANDNAFYQFDSNYRYGWYGSSYFPLTIVADQLGNPLGDFYSIQNCLVRDFENGKVVVNYNSISTSFNLGGTYRTVDGATVTSITMGANTGAIYLRAP